MPCIPKNSFTTHQARCLVSVSERHSLFSFSLLSLTVESVIHAHGLSDRRYLLLFELKHNNKQQMNLQIWFWSVEQLISRPWLLLIAIAISCLRFDKCPRFNFLIPVFCRAFLFFLFSVFNLKCRQNVSLGVRGFNFPTSAWCQHIPWGNIEIKILRKRNKKILECGYFEEKGYKTFHACQGLPMLLLLSGFNDINISKNMH